MRRRIIIIGIICMFILTGCGLLCWFFYGGKTESKGDTVKAGEKVVLASELNNRAENTEEVVSGKQEDSNQSQTTCDAVYTNLATEINDPIARKVFDLILINHSVIADRYQDTNNIDSNYMQKSSLAEDRDDEFYSIRKKKKELDKEAMAYYESLMDELKRNPQNWKSVWKRYKDYAIEYYAKVRNFDYDLEVKKITYLKTEEGKELAEQGGITEKVIEQWQKRYEEVKEYTREEVRKQLEESAKEAGIPE
ncbi:hypothetical protein [Caldicellulosiruptor sp. DIB 104C]|nr:hypothetical protein [Caldicellulosiruptor sp. DIB 104C]